MVCQKTVLILGGGGLGINIAKTLLAKESYCVTIADNFSRGNQRLSELGD